MEVFGLKNLTLIYSDNYSQFSKEKET